MKERLKCIKKDIDNAWEKAKPIRSQNPDVYRKDDYGNKIRKASYGTQGDYGWELDLVAQHLI